jgi:hypothetical protein
MAAIDEELALDRELNDRIRHTSALGEDRPASSSSSDAR